MLKILLSASGLATLILGSILLPTDVARAQDEAASKAAAPQVPSKAHRHRHKTARLGSGPTPVATQGDDPGGINGPPRNPKTQRANGTLEGEADKARPAERKGASSKSVISSDAIQNGGAQNTYDAVKNVPGVTQSDAKGGGVADNIQIRGIHLQSSTGYRLDGGLAIENDLIMPIEDKERIEALKGAGALAFGVASPAGVINLVMKRATELPILSFGLAANEFGQAIGTIDFGERFGFDKQFGIRTILSGGEVSSGVHNATGIKGLGAVAFDWQPNDRFSLKVDFEQFGVDVVEQAILLQDKPVNGLVPLPRIPNYYQLLSGPWAKYQGIGQNIFLSGVYQLDYGFQVVAEVGRSESRKLQRNLAQVGNYNITTGLGTETVTLIDNQDYVNTYVKGELKNHFEYALFTNDLTLGINRNERFFNGTTNGSFKFAQNIYNPFPGSTPPSPQPGAYYPNDSNDVGYYFQEDIGLFQRLHILGGVQQIVYNEYALSRANGLLQHNLYNFTAPGVGAVADIFPGIQLYASYLSSLQETGQAPQNSLNAFEVQLPAPATQKEVGVRATNIYNASATLAAFEIVQANAITDSVTNIFGVNGTQTVKGVEGTLRYVILPQFVNLVLVAGGQVGSSFQHSTDPLINGKESENVPRVSGNAGLIYRPDFIKGLTLNGGVLFTGSRQLTDQEQGKIPAVLVYNIGANYVTSIEGHRVTYNISCQNLTDLKYFSAAVNGALGIGRPRTILFGGRVDF